MSTLFYVVFILACLPYVILFFQVLFDLWPRKPKATYENIKINFSAPVSFILICYNEEKHILRKINSLLDESNWIDGSEIIVVSGGSTDSTEKILKFFDEHPQIKLLLYNERISKIRGINIAVKNSNNEILVFSDFRQDIKLGSIPILVRNFKDPSIGIAAGTLIDTKSFKKPSLVRSIMNKMAINSSLNSSSLTIYGALYAQRKSSFREIPENILFDDLYVTASILGQNSRLIQEKDAIIYDYNFNEYYDRERIMRLARGLLLFLFNHYYLIQKIPLKLRVRFFIFKYIKLIFPFSLLIFIVSLFTLVFYNNYFIAIIFLVFIFSITSKNFLEIFKFHYYLGKAIILFLFRQQRSVFWEKLKIDR